MPRIRYTARCRYQVGTSPMDIVSYEGEEGKVEDVPADVAKALVEQGWAEPEKAKKA